MSKTETGVHVSPRDVYTEYRGLWFTPNTPQQVRDVLADHLRTRSHQEAIRLRILYGNTQTGEAWITEEYRQKFDVRSDGEIGYIGRSTGQYKIPLAVYNASNIGGSAILTDCIVRIETTRGGRVLYSHPNFHYHEEVTP